jgi:hypothetical protein
VGSGKYLSFARGDEVDVGYVSSRRKMPPAANFPQKPHHGYKNPLTFLLPPSFSFLQQQTEIIFFLSTTDRNV